MIATQAFGSAGGLLLTVASARVLTPRMFGDFNLGITISAFAAPLLPLGLVRLALRRHAQAGADGVSRAWVTNASLTAAAVGLVLVPVSALLLDDNSDTGSLTFASFVYVTALTNAISVVLAYALLGVGDRRSAFLVGGGPQRFARGATVAIVAVAGVATFDSVALASAAACAVPAALAILYCLRIASGSIGVAVPSIRERVRMSWADASTGLSSSVLVLAPAVVLSADDYARFIGPYRLAFILGTARQVVEQTVMPRSARAVGLSGLSLRRALMGSGVVLTAAAVLGLPLMEVTPRVLGDAYRVPYALMAAVAGVALCEVAGGVGRGTLTMVDGGELVMVVLDLVLITTVVIACGVASAREWPLAALGVTLFACDFLWMTAVNLMAARRSGR